MIRAPVSLAQERLFVQAVYRQVENKTKPVLPGPMPSSRPYKTQMCDRGEGSLVPLQKRSYMGWGGDRQMHRSRKWARALHRPPLTLAEGTLSSERADCQTKVTQ